MTNLIVLGPQYPEPRLSTTLLDELGLGEPLCAITAGWQEREGELEDLRRYVGREVTDLELYRRTDEIRQRDPELMAAHRERQDKLKQLQGLYRRRLHHAREAARELLNIEGEDEVLRSEQRAAMASLRNLDRHHLQRITRIHETFDAQWDPGRRPILAAHRERVGHIIEESVAVLIAGGHVGALMSRMRLFGMHERLRGRPIIAWSAGAMVLGEKIVLFHDSPPQGPSAPEVFDAALGLIGGYVFLPNASKRLLLEDRSRVALFARRFLPARSITLESGSVLRWDRGRLVSADGSQRLTRTGQIKEMRAI